MPRPRFRSESSGPRAGAAGAAAGAVALAAGELAAAGLPGAHSPLSGLGRSLIDRLPGPAVDMTVATAESLDKPLLAGALLAESIGAGALAAQLARRGRPSGPVLLAQGAFAGVAAASRPQSSAASSLAAGVLGGAVGAGALRILRRRPSPSRLAGAAALAAAAGGLARAVRRHRERPALAARERIVLPGATRRAPPPPPGAQLDVPGVTPLFTPPEAFYVTDVAFPAPRVDPATWRLRIHGLVECELELTLDDLLAMELSELDATLVCVHNPIGGPRIGTARWLGVPLADLLAHARVEPAAEQLVAHSVDGFSAGVPLDHLAGGAPALVAVGLNGEPLPVANGFPARLLVPGLWGADASTKWLSALELTTWAAIEDYWDARGWPRRPPTVRPGSRIDVPTHRSRLTAGPTTIAGVAWAPPAGVEAVELSIDDGPWIGAEIAAEVAPTAWRQWRHVWHAAPGEHRLRVRAVGRAGVQPADPAPPYPEGSGGYHEVRLWSHGSPPRITRRRDLLADAAADAGRRLALAAAAPPAWVRYGYPRRPRFPDP